MGIDIQQRTDDDASVNFRSEWRRVVMSAISMSCIDCGYDLRGTDLRFDCPECGLPIEISDARNMLALLDPKWLASISAGAVVQKWLARLTTLVVIGFGGTWIAGAGVNSTGVIVTIGVLCVVAMIGAWFAASPPRLRVFPTSILASARAAQCCAVVVAVGSALTTIFYLAFGRSTLVWETLFVLSPVGLAGAIGAGCYVNYLCHTAHQFRDDVTRAKGSAYAGGFFTGCAFVVLGGVIAAIVGVSSVYWVLPGLAAQLIGGALLLRLSRNLVERLELLRNESHRIWQDHYNSAASRRHRRPGAYDRLTRR
ncbi:MAG TPA: hypothetical protein P5081_02495 [Phycisphaerae bacterium]|nr:hypothetical protein [Phycisphaerae bacterium]HRW51726.1 hypothetical protein [Phycisphaerae bacterium]